MKNGSLAGIDTGSIGYHRLSYQKDFTEALGFGVFTGAVATVPVATFIAVRPLPVRVLPRRREPRGSIAHG